MIDGACDVIEMRAGEVVQVGCVRSSEIKAGCEVRHLAPSNFVSTFLCDAPGLSAARPAIWPKAKRESLVCHCPNRPISLAVAHCD